VADRQGSDTALTVRNGGITMDTIGIRADVGLRSPHHAMRGGSLAAHTAAALVNQCFKRDLGHSLKVWLIYDQRTHGGLLFLVGSVRPHKRKLRRMSHLFGVAEVPPCQELRAALSTHGPEALRFNGVCVALAGH
jgi:hypothetical protein